MPDVRSQEIGNYWQGGSRNHGVRIDHAAHSFHSRDAIAVDDQSARGNAG